MPIQDRISSLDDATARRVLATFARAQANPAETALTPELRQALREFAPAPEAAAMICDIQRPQVIDAGRE